MNFDMVSMKQRAKALMSTTKPDPRGIGTIFAGLLIAYIVAMGLALADANLIAILIIEVLYMNFRNSNRLYGLKVSREEKTNISDVFSAFKNKPVQQIVLCLLKDIMNVLGVCFFYVGALVPFYCFRFSSQIVNDEKVNAFKALKRSCQLLKGHYIELIKIDITVFALYLIIWVTCGIYGLYVKPYSVIIYAEFYDYLKACEEMNI